MEIGYAPSLRWYRSLFRSIISGEEPPRPEVRPNRCTILHGSERVVLSIPLCGGGRLARILPPSRLKMSDHGRWRHMHVGALNAAYGKAPYFDHYAPALFDILQDGDGSGSLGEFASRIHDAVWDMLHIPSLLDFLSSPSAPRPALPADEVDDDLSVFHLLFNYGPEAIFYFLPR